MDLTKVGDQVLFRGRTRISCVCFLEIYLTACSGPSVSPDLQLSFKPFVLPMAVTWSAQEGVSIGFKSPDLITPLGVINASINLNRASDLFPQKRLLLVVVGRASFVYELTKSKVSLELPNNLSGNATIITEGESICLTIPHPDRVGAPRRLDAGYIEKLPTIRLGSADLLASSSLSLALGKVSNARGDLTFREGELWADFINDLGPVDLHSVRKVPTTATSGLLMVNLRNFGIFDDGWRQNVPPTLGHTYAFKANSHYAIAQVIAHVEGRSVSLRYKFQTDGSRNF